jgi:hypothetical protein
VGLITAALAIACAGGVAFYDRGAIGLMVTVALVPLAAGLCASVGRSAGPARATYYAAAVFVMSGFVVALGQLRGTDMPAFVRPPGWAATLGVASAGLLVLLLGPRGRRDAVTGGSLPLWWAPVGAALGFGFALLAPARASTGGASLVELLAPLPIGRGLAELGVLGAITLGSLVRGRVRAPLMIGLPAAAAAVAAALFPLVRSGPSEAVALVLCGAGAAIFATLVYLALGIADRWVRAAVGAAAYLLGCAPVALALGLALGASALQARVAEAFTLAALHGFLLGWVPTTQGLRGPAPRPRAPMPVGLVARALALPLVWSAYVLWMGAVDGRARQAVPLAAIGALCAVLAVACASVPRPFGRGLLLAGLLIVPLAGFGAVAETLAYRGRPFAARWAIVPLLVATGILVDQILRVLDRGRVRDYHRMNETAPALSGPARVLARWRPLGSLAVPALATALALPAAARSAALWQLQPAPWPAQGGALAEASEPATAPPAWRTGSAIVFDGDHRALHVLDAERGELVSFSLTTHEPMARTLVGRGPCQMVLGKDGTVFVSVSGDGQIVAVPPSRQVARADFPGEPWGLARSDDGGTLYVTLAVADRVVALDTATLAVKWQTEVAPRPRAITLAADGTLLVGHVRHPALSAVSPRGRRLADIPLRSEPHRVATQAWALVGVGDRVHALHSLVDTGLERASFAEAESDHGEYGGGAGDPVVAAETRVNRRLSSLPARGAGDVFLGSFPIADAGLFLERQQRLVVASRGADKLRLRIPGLEGDGVVNVIDVDVSSPTALAADQSSGTLFVLSLSEEERAVVVVEPDGRVSPERFRLGASPLSAQFRRGRRLFHSLSGRISAHQLACASCHPEGREDGLTWRLDRARRQTPALAGRLTDTAPYNWLGTQETLEGNIAQTTQRLGGSGLDDASLRDLASYLREAAPPDPAPASPGPRERALVTYGRHVFERADVGCAGCHVPDTGFSDGLEHDVGTTSKRELAELGKAPAYNTPSLRQLRLTAPYLHDGSAATLDAVLARTDGRMGRTGHLSTHERRALLAYLSTL